MKIVWHCEDRAGLAMAGPAIRATELCARLASRHEVTLACPGASSLRGVPYATIELAEGASVRPLLKTLGDGGAFVAQGFGFPLRDLAALPRGARLVLDLYDPVQLELLARYGRTPLPEQRLHLMTVRRRLLSLLTRADHVLCASERQRAFWLGWLSALGRLTPEAVGEDPQAMSLLAIVPFGIEGGAALVAEPPHERVAGPQREQGLVQAVVGSGELPVLWWGGLWDWMDPVTAVRAIDRVRRQGVPAALVLPAANRPGAPPMKATGLALEEAKARGLWGRGKGVTQLAAWVPYGERRAVLDASAVALTCHKPSLEAELSFRTRLLDCVWAGLPAVATSGDELSARGEREGWIAIAPAGDVDAVAAALRLLLSPERRKAARAAALRVREAYSWDRSAAGLFHLLEGAPPVRGAAAGWGPAAALAPEVAFAPPLEVVKAAAGKLLARARRGRPGS